MEKLIALRKEKGLTQLEASKILGISRQAYSNYELGNREPDYEMLQKIAAYFDVSVDYLLGRSTTKTQSPSPAPANYPGIIIPKMKKVPLLGKVACGEPIYSPNFDDGYALLDEDFAADFALQAKGDSMKNAHILDGDIVYFVAQDTVDNGQIAAVVIDDEVTLKRVYYYREQNKLILQPENAAYEPLVYLGHELDNIRIIGRAVAHLRKL